MKTIPPLWFYIKAQKIKNARLWILKNTHIKKRDIMILKVTNSSNHVIDVSFPLE